MKPPRIKKYCAGGLATRGRELSCARTVLVLYSRIDVRDGMCKGSSCQSSLPFLALYL